MGKLIVIEGLDGCGKSTQLDRLFERLKASDVNCRKVSLPNYGSKACEPVKMYLNGDFGKTPESVNAYAASAFYAVDRYASFKEDWGEFYNNGGIVLCGRYVTSNVIHQCSKLPQDKWEDFCNWLYDFEYNKMGIPVPDAVLFLNMPQEVSDKLLATRYGGDESRRDIHESSAEYQKHCRNAAVFAARQNGWISIDCTSDGTLRSIESIADEIFDIVKKLI